MMKRLLILTAVVVGIAGLAMAQTTTKPLADVAKEEEARRRSVRKPAKVYTNDNLKPDISAGVALPPSTPSDASKPATPESANATPSAPSANQPNAKPPAAAKDQAYWSGRIQAARAAMERMQIFADSLQSRINALTTDVVNRDDPAQRAKLEGDRKAALAELERLTKELDAQRAAIAAIEDEARRAGVPPGWLRPSA